MGRRRGAETAAAAVLLVAALPGTRASPEEGVQPLSKIAIHAATIELQPSAYVRATPTLLGGKGEDTEWVTVKYGSPNPSADDWIGVFSPADFN